MSTYDTWGSGARCRHCRRLVAEGSAYEDDDSNLRDAHWDCARRAEMAQRARDARPTASERSLRGRIDACTRWANTVTEARQEFGGISTTTFYELVNAGVLPIVKLGRRTFVAPSER